MSEVNFILLFFDLILTIFMYEFIPVILICILKREYTEKQAKKIAIINALSVWFITAIVCILDGETPTLYGADFLWGAVGYYILKPKKKNTENIKDDSEIVQLVNELENKATTIPQESYIADDKEKEQKIETIKANYCENCGNKLLEDDKFCCDCGNKISLPK